MRLGASSIDGEDDVVVAQGVLGRVAKSGVRGSMDYKASRVHSWLIAVFAAHVKVKMQSKADHMAMSLCHARPQRPRLR